MTNDEIPNSVAVVVGHVCGVIAVAMAALGLWGIWLLMHKATWPGAAMVSVPVALSVLMFRWAGALTGYWNTRGRLSVPKVVYAIFRYVFAAMGAAGAAFLVVDPPTSLLQAARGLFGVASAAALSYICHLAAKRFD